MSTLAATLQAHKKQWMWAVGAVGFALLWFAISIPTLNRSREAANESAGLARSQLQTEPAVSLYQNATRSPSSAPVAEDATAETIASVGPIGTPSDAFDQRMMIRTSSLELVVPHPAETAAQIENLAERLGGYLENSSGSSLDANGWSMTVRIPAKKFDEMRGEVRKLGLRVESEKISAQDVTRQYVDQEATLRNLHAEETQYLAILKQATTVKDMLAVSQRLMEVRGQIEQQQAEFNALSKQVQTVAISISLRAEAQAEVFGLHWRPLYQLKIAFRDGLESLATYASVMVSLLFYLPTVILWMGTILGSIFLGWKTIRWMGRRWFGWQKPVTPTTQQA